MNLLHILILAIVQGVAELLPVSSSAHVIVAEKLMGLDPTAPEMTMLLVMLHTGTMFAVIVYFWRAWADTYFSSLAVFKASAVQILLATAVTGVIGIVLMEVIKHVFVANSATFEIEQLFGNTKLIALALAAAGVLIIASSRIGVAKGDVSARKAALIGAVQGLCLPFRGFSRSGATISVALACGIERKRAEQFSFALAVVLTPPVIAKELLRLYHAKAALSVDQTRAMLHLVAPGLVGMGLSFFAGLIALRWLSRWLEGGRWHLFGAYCLVAAGFIGWFGSVHP